MVLSPLPVARAATAVLGAAAAVVGAGFLLDRPVPGLSHVAAGALFVLAVVVAMRSPRMGIRCDSRGVTVRGLLWSRTVPRSSIEEVTDFPALRWRTAEGRARWTPVTFFMSSNRTLPFVRRHNAESVERLRRWVEH